jgi:hypothetical protein
VARLVDSIPMIGTDWTNSASNSFTLAIFSTLYCANLSGHWLRRRVRNGATGVAEHMVHRTIYATLVRQRRGAQNLQNHNMGCV